MRRALPLLGAMLVAALGCGDDDPIIEVRTEEVATSEEEAGIDGVQQLPGGRSLYLKCIGEGSPTVVMEAGDDGTSAYYDDLQLAVANETRACSYDRANLGKSGPATGPHRLPDQLKDLADLLRVAGVDAPYVLVGSSGGGRIVAAYAARHRRQTGGLVLFDTPAPERAPRPVGDVPVRIVTVRPNTGGQMRWLKLSPRARQTVVDTGHDVVGEDLPFAAEAVLSVVREAKG